MPDISKWDTSNVIYIGGSFSDLLSLAHLPNFNYNEFIKTSMFFGCTFSLPDISKWNTSKIIDMRNMIRGNKLLLSLSEIEKFERLDQEELERIEEEKKSKKKNNY